ncbi:MAG: FlgD immunoglobulin-like domain containing protein [bacterium]
MSYIRANSSIEALTSNNDGTLFASLCGYGIDCGLGVLLYSTDRGKSWKELEHDSTGLGWSCLWSFAVAANGAIFAGSQADYLCGIPFGRVYRSLDGGFTWQEVFTDSSIARVTALAVSLNGDIFAGTFYGGVFHSTDNGVSWPAVNSGLTTTNISSLAVHPSGYLFAGTGFGVFRTVRKTSVTQNANGSPFEFFVEQNYPNPFNAGTEIRFQIPSSMHVKVVVYDQQGRLIRTLVDQFQPAGVYRAKWDGRDNSNAAMASGVYFCRFQAGASFAVMRKMMLLR